MKKYAVFLTFLPCSCAHCPFESWSKEDTVGELVWVGFAALDWGQTLDIAGTPERFRELNPLLGPHPSRADVNAYFIGGLFLHPIVSGTLSPKYRKYWQYTTIGAEMFCTINNYSIGLRAAW